MSALLDPRTVGWVSVSLAVTVVWPSLRLAGRLHMVLTDTGTTLLTRIAGLLLSAIAVEVVPDGVRAVVSAPA